MASHAYSNQLHIIKTPSHGISPRQPVSQQKPQVSTHWPRAFCGISGKTPYIHKSPKQFSITIPPPLPENPSTYSEVQLLQGIRNRDKGVVEYINREYRPSIRLFIYRMGGEWADAKDLFQDAIIVLIRMSENYPGPAGKFCCCISGTIKTARSPGY